MSKCCNADVQVEGQETHYYVCTECGLPCDLKIVEEVANDCSREG